VVLTSSNSEDPVFFEISDQIGYIVLNDPPENRMTLRFFEMLQTIIDRVRLLDTLKGVVICSNSRHFSSGADLPELTSALRQERSADSDAHLSILVKNSHCFTAISELKMPVIAAIQGLCMGSAYELALCADVRVAEPHSTLGLPEVEYGVMPGCGGTVRLSKLTGTASALELILSGQLLAADEALREGLVDIVVLRKQAVGYARKIIIDAYGKCEKKSIISMVRKETGCYISGSSDLVNKT